MRWAMMVRKVFSTALTCIRDLEVVSIAAGVQEVMDETIRGARVGRAVHNPGRIFMMACRTAGSLPY